MKAARYVSVVLAFAAVGTLSLGACARDAQDRPATIVVDGVTRAYVMHVPAKLGSRVPLVLSFHGHFGTGQGQSRLTGMDALSDRYGFIVVYPNGIKGGWNDGGAENAGAADVAFAQALIDDFSKRYPIDSKRVYATGFSNGATFTQYLGCRLANRLAAIAPVSGYMPVEDAGCRPARPLPVLEIGGTADPVMPYRGGEVTIGRLKRGKVLSAQQTIAMWKANAKCVGAPQVRTLAPVAPPDGTHVTRTAYTNCSPGAAIELYTVTGGGHAWPEGPQYLPSRFIGKASNQLNTSDAIVAFFYAHPMH